MDSKKKAVLIVVVIATLAYEVFLFGYLFNGEKGPFAFSVFFAYAFSLAGAIPLALILAWIGGEARKFGDVKESFGE